MDGKRGVGVHGLHVWKVLTFMRNNKLYANLKKSIFATSEIPFLECIVGKHVLRPDPKKIKPITGCSVRTDVKGFRVSYIGSVLHKYSHNYAKMTVHLSRFCKRTRSDYGVPNVSAPSKVSRKG